MAGDERVHGGHGHTLTHAHKSATKQKGVKGVAGAERGEGGAKGPEKHARAKHLLATEAVGKHTTRELREGVADEEGGLDEALLAFGPAEVAAHW